MERLLISLIVGRTLRILYNFELLCDLLCKKKKRYNKILKITFKSVILISHQETRNQLELLILYKMRKYQF